MKSLIILLSLLVPVLAVQTPEICDPCTFEWDAPGNMAGVDEYRFYIAETSGGHDFTTPDAVLPLDTRQAEFTSPRILPGIVYYGVVTAANAGEQSLPSNEVSFQVPFIVPEPPTGLRIRISASADGDIEVELWAPCNKEPAFNVRP